MLVLILVTLIFDFANFNYNLLNISN